MSKTTAAGIALKKSSVFYADTIYIVTMKTENGKCVFEPSTKVNIIEEPFTDPIYCPRDKLLYFKAFYRLGNLKTDMDNPLLALKFLPGSLDIMLIEPIPGTQEARRLIDIHPHIAALDAIGMPHSEIVPEYNCHGLCFADKEYRIPDVTILLQDEYIECNETDSEYVVYFNGKETVHSAIRNNSKYLAKLGYRGLHSFDSPESAACDLKYESYRFYRKKVL